jgi:ectoine hydroxylase-related dioxygenase (phytanoyl-CoA dioxygenase family)
MTPTVPVSIEEISRPPLVADGRSAIADDPETLLPQDQSAFFHREGYLVVRAVTTPMEIQQIRLVYERLFAEKAGWKDGNYLDFAGADAQSERLPQILMPSEYEPSLKQTRLFRTCHAIARQLLGPSAEFVFDHGMTKPARGGVPTPWHQDKAFYTRKTTHETITFWVPLQRVTAESGCLRFIPGSHSGPLFKHRHLNDDPRIHGLEALGIDETHAVSCPLDVGDATIHHHRMLHGADTNVSGEPRWAYAMGFGVRTAIPTVAREHQWNRLGLTERERRVLSRSHWGRMKQTARSTLLRLGFL